MSIPGAWHQRNHFRMSTFFLFPGGNTLNGRVKKREKTLVRREISRRDEQWDLPVCVTKGGEKEVSQLIAPKVVLNNLIENQEERNTRDFNSDHQTRSATASRMILWKNRFPWLKRRRSLSRNDREKRKEWSRRSSLFVSGRRRDSSSVPIDG